MFKKSKFGCKLIIQCLLVFQHHPKLALPIAISRALFLGILTAGVLLLNYLRIHPAMYNQIKTSYFVGGYLGFLFILYLCNILQSICTGTAIVYFNQQQQNQSPDLTSCWRTASSHFKAFFLWVTFFLFIGPLIGLFKSIRKYQPIQKALSGLDWNSAHYLIYPVLIEHSLSPLPALTYASEMMRNFAGIHPKPRFSFSILLILRLILLLPITIGSLLRNLPLMIVGAIISSLGILLISIVITIIHTILPSAIYWYLTRGQSPKFFQLEDIQNLFTSPQKPSQKSKIYN